MGASISISRRHTDPTEITLDNLETILPQYLPFEDEESRNILIALKKKNELTQEHLNILNIFNQKLLYTVDLMPAQVLKFWNELDNKNQLPDLLKKYLIAIFSNHGVVESVAGQAEYDDIKPEYQNVFPKPDTQEVEVTEMKQGEVAPNGLCFLNSILALLIAKAKKGYQPAKDILQKIHDYEAVPRTLITNIVSVNDLLSTNNYQYNKHYAQRLKCMFIDGWRNSNNLYIVTQRPLDFANVNIDQKAEESKSNQEWESSRNSGQSSQVISTQYMTLGNHQIFSNLFPGWNLFVTIDLVKKKDLKTSIENNSKELTNPIEQRLHIIHINGNHYVPLEVKMQVVQNENQTNPTVEDQNVPPQPPNKSNSQEERIIQKYLSIGNPNIANTENTKNLVNTKNSLIMELNDLIEQLLDQDLEIPNILFDLKTDAERQKAVETLKAIMFNGEQGLKSKEEIEEKMSAYLNQLNIPTTSALSKSPKSCSAKIQKNNPGFNISLKAF